MEDAFDDFHAYALDVISESAMGIKLNSQTDPNSKFVQANTEILLSIYHRVIYPQYRNEFIWKLSSTYKKQVEIIKYIDNFINDLIEKRRGEILAKITTDNKSEDTKEKPALLDILLQSEMDGKPLSNEDIRGEVNTFMFAGHETTGSTLAFTFYLLAKHPKQQETLYEEIKSHGLINNNEPLTMRALNSLPYLDGTLKETLRIHPIFSMFKLCMNSMLYQLYCGTLLQDAELKRMNIPHPEGVPIFGYLFKILKAAKQRKMLFAILDLHKNYGDTIMFRTLNRVTVCTRDVNLMEIIANNPKFIKPQVYDYLKVWLGNSLVITHGERWYKLRKLLTPAFHFQILERFIQIFEEQADVLINKMKNSRDGVMKNAFDDFHAYALDVISESAMGIKLDSQNDPKSKSIQATAGMLYSIYERYANPLYKRDFIWKCTSTYKKQAETIKYIDNFIDNIIDKRRAEILLKFSSVDEKEMTKEKPALLDILLQSEMDDKPLSNEDIRGEVNTFMFAGHETTGSTLAFTFYLLAKHPKQQEILF
uniref:CSON009396 protein n=1 Tax=Culicoides sonorensis TaxID=179676 RepID=A0A336M5J0_CULSO